MFPGLPVISTPIGDAGPKLSGSDKSSRFEKPGRAVRDTRAAVLLLAKRSSNSTDAPLELRAALNALTIQMGWEY